MVVSVRHENLHPKEIHEGKHSLMALLCKVVPSNKVQESRNREKEIIQKYIIIAINENIQKLF